MVKQNISPQTEQEALAIAKATQKPSQTKEQTRLIAKGIEKGIAEYKKRQKAKARDLDKKRKKLDQKVERLDSTVEAEPAPDSAKSKITPTLLALLLLSLAGNVIQFLFNK